MPSDPLGLTPVPRSWSAIRTSTRSTSRRRTTTLFSHTPCQAVVAGSRATLTIPGSFYAPGDFTLTANDNVTRLQHREEPTRYRQLFHEAIRRDGVDAPDGICVPRWRC
jgi:hypothetical protein